MFNDNPWSNKT